METNNGGIYKQKLKTAIQNELRTINKIGFGLYKVSLSKKRSFVKSQSV